MDGLSTPFKLSHFIDLIFLFVRYIQNRYIKEKRVFVKKKMSFSFIHLFLLESFFYFLLLFCKCLTPSRVADYDKLNYDKVTNYL